MYISDGSLLEFTVSYNGVINYSIDGERKDILRTGPDSCYPLWMVVDMFGLETIQLEQDAAPSQMTSSASLSTIPTELLPAGDAVGETELIVQSASNDSPMTSSSIAPSSEIEVAATVQSSDLRFHAVCGVGIRLEDGGRRAVSGNLFAQGIAFSDRPISINERVCLRLARVSPGRVRSQLAIGLTSICPDSHQEMPRYLRSGSGYWVADLPERHTSEGNLVEFFVTPNGDVHYDINEQYKGFLLANVDTTCPLWMAVDIYEPPMTIELPRSADPRLPMTSSSIPQECTQFRGSMPIFHNQELQFFSRKSRKEDSGVNKMDLVSSGNSITLYDRWNAAWNRFSSSNSHLTRLPTVSEAVQSKQHKTRPLAWSLFGSTKQGTKPKTSSSTYRGFAKSVSTQTTPSSMVTIGTQSEVPPRSIDSECQTSPLSTRTTGTQYQNQKPSTMARDECSVCMDAKPDAALDPCGHSSICYKCAMECKRSQNRCPFCLRCIVKVLKTYSG